MSKIYFVRHGESQANVDGIVAGWQDSPLTEKGVQQARDVAVTIQEMGIKFDIILTSTLRRAYDTAVFIAQASGYPVDEIIVIDDLKEKGGGKFEGQFIASLQVASAEDVQGDGAETFTDFADRVLRANREIRHLVTGTTLVVGHSGFYRMAHVVFDNLDPADMTRIDRPANGKLLEYPLK